MLEKTSDDALTNAGKNVTSTIACARSQRYTKNSIFRLAQMTLTIMTLHNFPSYVVPNEILTGLTSE